MEQKSNRTHTPPPKFEDLGDGTYYYNYEIVESESEEGYKVYDYKQTRHNMPIDESKHV